MNTKKLLLVLAALLSPVTARAEDLTGATHLEVGLSATPFVLAAFRGGLYAGASVEPELRLTIALDPAAHHRLFLSGRWTGASVLVRAVGGSSDTETPGTTPLEEVPAAIGIGHSVSIAGTALRLAGGVWLLNTPYDDGYVSGVALGVNLAVTLPLRLGH